MLNRKYLVIIISGLLSFNTLAQSVSYTTINNRVVFQKRWNLSDDEMKRYEIVMDVEGKFRYPKLTPLEVLAITAPDESTMRYYAKKAAQDEFNAVENQLKYTMMVTEEKTKIWQQAKKEKELERAKQQLEKANQAKIQRTINQIPSPTSKNG